MSQPILYVGKNAIRDKLISDLSAVRGEKRKLDDRIESSAKRILLGNKIEFHEARRSIKFELSHLKSKYILLKKSKSNSTFGLLPAQESIQHEAIDNSPLRIPFEEDTHRSHNGLRMDYHCKRNQGLHNLGNTCFLNSVIQCLASLPALVYYCTAEHTKSCVRQGAGCHACYLSSVVSRMQCSQHPVHPDCLVKTLTSICRTMLPGRQHDAHEYLIYLLDVVGECLKSRRHKSLKSISEETVISRIFGGTTRSQVICGQCGYKSNTIQKFLQLSLDISQHWVSSIQQSLKLYTSPDRLYGNNQYKCEKCKRAVDAKKYVRIQKCPNILVLHLKRFKGMQIPGKYCKDTKMVQFMPTLDLKPSLTHDASTKTVQQVNESCMYELRGMVIHYGDSSHSGHYIAYTATSAGQWYKYDDSQVSRVSLQEVLEKKAYILFYVKKGLKRPVSTIPSVVAQPTQQPSWQHKVGAGSLAPDVLDSTTTSRENRPVEPDMVTAKSPLIPNLPKRISGGVIGCSQVQKNFVKSPAVRNGPSNVRSPKPDTFSGNMNIGTDILSAAKLSSSVGSVNYSTGVHGNHVVDGSSQISPTPYKKGAADPKISFKINRKYANNSLASISTNYHGNGGSDLSPERVFSINRKVAFGNGGKTTNDWFNSDVKLKRLNKKGGYVVTKERIVDVLYDRQRVEKRWDPTSGRGDAKSQPVQQRKVNDYVKQWLSGGTHHPPAVVRSDRAVSGGECARSMTQWNVSAHHTEDGTSRTSNGSSTNEWKVSSVKA